MTAIAAGADHCLALTAGGEVFSWGSGGNGRLGHGRPPGMRFFRRHAPEFRPRVIRQLEALRITQVIARRAGAPAFEQQSVRCSFCLARSPLAS